MSRCGQCAKTCRWCREWGRTSLTGLRRRITWLWVLLAVNLALGSVGIGATSWLEVVPAWLGALIGFLYGFALTHLGLTAIRRAERRYIEAVVEHARIQVLLDRVTVDRIHNREQAAKKAKADRIAAQMAALHQASERVAELRRKYSHHPPKED